MIISQISSQGQTTIPIKIIQKLVSQPGSSIKWEIIEDNIGIIQAKITASSIQSLKALRGSAQGVYSKDYLKKERASWAR